MLNQIIEATSYLIIGGLTTLVNYVVFGSLIYLKANLLISNSLAWLVAVLFAYGANRRWVFHSKQEVHEEFFSFVFLRLISLMIENGLLMVGVHWLGWSIVLTKILVSFVTIVFNYVFCKWFIFQAKEVLNHV